MPSRLFKCAVWVVRGMAIGLFVVTCGVWIFCQTDQLIVSRRFDLWVNITHGWVEWCSRFHYFWIDPARPATAAAVLAVAVCLFRDLRTTLGMMVLAVAVHVVVLNCYNYIANVLLFIFDIGCLWLVKDRPLFRPAVVNPLICVKCGYDLRATPERCPECGTVVARLKPTDDAAVVPQGPE